MQQICIILSITITQIKNMALRVPLLDLSISYKESLVDPTTWSLLIDCFIKTRNSMTLYGVTNL